MNRKKCTVKRSACHLQECTARSISQRCVAEGVCVRGVCWKLLRMPGTLCLPFSLLLLLFLHTDPGCGERAFFFQPDNIPTTSSLASITLQPPPTSPSDPSPPVLTNLSVCARLKVHHFREKTYVYSYATSDKDNNELNMALKTNTVYISVGSSYKYGPKNETYLPGVWYHVCFVVDYKTINIYVDGQFLRSEEINERSILLNGSLVLGQETDKVMGGFQEQQSFSGIITGFNLYSRALSSSEVTLLARCEPGVDEGDVVAWSRAPWLLQGHVTDLDLPPEEYCNKSQRIIIFPERRSWTDSFNLCHNLKSSVTMPLTAAANTRLYDIAVPFAPQCQPPNHATAFLWLAATDKEEIGKWTDLQGNPLTFTNFGGTYKSSKRDCLAMLVPPYREKWDDISCGDIYHLCVGCQEGKKGLGVVRARGMCEEDEKAAWFTLEQLEGIRPYFKGYTKYVIVPEEAESRWSLLDMWQNKTLAHYPTHDLSYPLGTHTWNLTSNYDVCGKVAGTPHLLTLSACHASEYTCWDGTCVNLTSRCDLRVDCPDNTDEIGCEKLMAPQDYLPSLTPAGVSPGALAMNLSLAILGFSKINLRDMKLTVDLSSTLSWLDQRLRYRNLKDIQEINHVELSQVWTPRVEYVNADFPDIETTPPQLTVARLSPLNQMTPRSIPTIFEGHKNPLQLSMKVNAPFSCTMNMRNFPFDTQYCHLLLRLVSARHDFLAWSYLNVTYEGETWLTEYEVGQVIVNKSVDGNYSLADVRITLYRRFWFYFTSTYVPTVMLMMISYASLFCKRQQSDLRVMMSLTTLLVLYALYQQISVDLPRTSYTKAVDVWCFFAITLIFTMVIFHVAIDVLDKVSFGLRRRRHVSTGSTSVSTKERTGSWGTMDKPPLPPRPLAARIMVTARFVYAAVILLFFVIYWTVVLVNVEY